LEITVVFAILYGWQVITGKLGSGPQRNGYLKSAMLDPCASFVYFEREKSHNSRYKNLYFRRYLNRYIFQW
jgi:hypothetical protein